MRLRACLFVLILSLLFISASEVLNAQVPTAGLIGAWTFSGNANDVSGSGNNGTVVNASLTIDRCGNANSAYSFNGSNSYIVMSSAGPTGNSSRSISFWAKTTATNLMTTFGYGTPSGGQAYAIQHNYNCQGIGVDVNNQALTRGNNCILNNAWHHIVAIINNTVGTALGNVIFYVDGVQLPLITCIISGTTQTINTGTGFPITIGKVADANARYFNGQLDDFYLYNRAITPTEVLQLYTANTCSTVISGPTVVCVGGVQVYSVTPIVGASSYSWSLPGGWTGTSTSNTISVTTTTSSGLIGVLGMPTGTCGNVGAASLSVSAIPTTTIAASANQTSICVGQSSTLTASGGTSYTWQPGGLNTASIIVSPTATTVYTITAINAIGCTATANVTQIVNPLPTISITTTGATVCAAQAVTLAASGANTYTWQPGSLVGAQVIINPTANSTYSVVGLAANGCQNSSTILISIYPPQTYTLASSANSICAGQSSTVTVSGGNSYTWQPGGTINSQIIISPTATTVYSITAFSPNSCSSTVNYTQFIYADPTIVVVSNSPTICPNTTTVITASGALNYTWFPGATAGNTLSVAPTSTSIFTVIGISAVGCTATATQTVFTKPTPTLSFNTSSITCGSLGSATVNTSGGVGPFTYSWLPTNQSGQNVSGLFPGTYSVTVSDIGTNCIITHTTYFAPLIPLTGTVIASDSLFCPLAITGTAGIVLAGGSGNYNYLYTGPSYTSSISSPTNLGNGQHTISITDQLTFCNVTHTFFIAQPTPFNLALTASSPSICIGDSILVTAINSGGTPAYSYTWQNAFVGNQYYAKESLPGNYTYTFVSNDSRLCSTTKTISLLFVPNPTVTVASVSLCPMTPLTLLASGASTYTWSTGHTGATRAIAFATSTVLTVTGTSLGCNAQAQSSITIYPAPIPTIITNAPVCAGNPLLLNVSGGVSYQWQGPNNFSSAQNGTTFPVASTSLTGNYQVTVTSVNACTTAASQFALVNPIPFFTAVGSTVCAGSSLSLNGSYIAGGNYAWSGPAFSAASQNIIIPNSTIATAGQYSLTITSVAGCSATAVASASVVVPPAVSITATNSVCASHSLSLSASGGGTYFWYGPNNFYSTQASATINAITLNAGGVYTLTTVFGPCTQQVMHTLTVHPLPIVAITGNSPLCENTSLQLQTGSFQSYTWTLPNSAQSNMPALQISSIGVAQQGSYSLSVTDGNGCAGSASYPVSVLTAPILIANNYSVCIGSRVTMTVSGAQSYTWTSTQAPVLTGSVYTIASAGVSLAGVYFVNATGSNSCSSTKQIQLSVLALDLPVVQTKTLVQVCDNSSITLSASGGSTYTWLSPFVSGNTQNTLVVNGADSLAAGIYSVVTVADNGCNSTSTVQVLKVFAPKAKLIANQTFCAPLCNYLAISPADTYSTTYFLNGLQLEANKVCIPGAGQYTIQATVSDANKCAVALQTVIVAGQKPKADFLFSPKTMALINEPIYLYNNSSAPPRSSLQWFFNDTLAPESNQENPVHYFPTGGKYPIVLVVTDNIGCTDTTIQIIEIGDEFTLYVPNSFSPNGDGTNDVFMPKGMGIKDYQLSIFNRWGQLLFSSNEASNCWDGRYKGSDCKGDTYQWVITTLDYKGQRKTTMGTVTIIR